MRRIRRYELSATDLKQAMANVLAMRATLLEAKPTVPSRRLGLDYRLFRLELVMRDGAVYQRTTGIATTAKPDDIVRNAALLHVQLSDPKAHRYFTQTHPPRVPAAA